MSAYSLRFIIINHACSCSVTIMSHHSLIGVHVLGVEWVYDFIFVLLMKCAWMACLQHGRLKVKTTEEQQKAKQEERAKKLKLYNAATSRAFQKVGYQFGSSCCFVCL